MLVDNVKRYLKLKNKEEELKDELEYVKNLVINEMNLKNITNFSEGGVTAKLIEKVTFEYKDESGIVRWLESNNMSSYITKKINVVALNKELKTSKSLNEGLDKMVAKKSSTALSVTEDSDK